MQCLDDGKYVDSKGVSRGTTGQTPLYCAEMIVSWMQAKFGIGIFIGQVGKSGEFLGADKKARGGKIELSLLSAPGKIVRRKIAPAAVARALGAALLSD